MKKFLAIMLACTLASTLILSVSCSRGEETKQQAEAFDESGFTGTDIKGLPGTIDMVGYGNLYSSYAYGEDGSVSMPAGFFAPLRSSRAKGGFAAKASIKREDGEFGIMSEAANTGALYVQTESIRHRIYVAGVNNEKGYIVVSGAKPHGYDSASDYFERRYPVPLESYCTGAPHTLEVSYLDGVYSVKFTSDDGKTFFKQIDKDTPYVSNPDFPSDMVEFFDDGERVLGLECMNVSARFSGASFKLGDKAASETFKVVRRKVTAVNSNPSNGNVMISNATPVTGEQVIVTVTPEDGCYVDAFTVNGVNRKGKLQKTNQEGVYSYELIGVQSDTVVRVSFVRGIEKKYTVTGTYSYTSGVYNTATGSYEIEGDALSVSAGIYEGTASDGIYSIDLPNGLFTVELESEKFPSASKQIVVSDADCSGGNIAFKRLNFTSEVVYNDDDSLTFSAQKTNRLFEDATADEGFVVNYKVTGTLGGYFNTGGLYIENEDGTYDYIFIFRSSRGSSSSVADIVLIESSRRWDNGPVYRTSYPYADNTKEIGVCIIYYNSQFHIILDGVYSCTIDKSSTLITQQGTLDDNFFNAKPRKLGLRNFDSAATFREVSYGIGNEAAVRAIEEKNVDVSAKAEGGNISLSVKAAQSSNQTTLDLGTPYTATLTPASENQYVSEFTINGVDSRYLLEGPYTVNGLPVWKCNLTAAQGGMEIKASFTDTKPTVYSVTGNYSYESGSESAVTVKAGNFYTGLAKDGQFSIDLPDGNYILAFTDTNEKSASKQVTVHGKEVNVGEVMFRDVGFDDMSGVTEVDGGWSIQGPNRYKNLSGNAVASDGFVVSYTVIATQSSSFHGGGFYMLKDGVYYTVYIMFRRETVNGVEVRKANIRLQQPNAGSNPVGTANYYTEYIYDTIEQPCEVTIAYYKQAFYIMLGNEYAYKIDSPSAMNQYKNEIDGRFFSAGYRTLGFRSMDSDVILKNVTYALGDEAALKVIHKMNGFETVE